MGEDPAVHKLHVGTWDGGDGEEELGEGGRAAAERARERPAARGSAGGRAEWPVRHNLVSSKL